MTCKFESSFGDEAFAILICVSWFCAPFLKLFDNKCRPNDSNDVKWGQKDVILDQTGVQNGIKIGLGGTPAEGSRTKSKKGRRGAGNRRPLGRHLDPKIDMFAHVGVIFSMFFRSCFLIDFLMVFW